MREAFLRALAGEVSDEVVWTADIDYWIAGQRFAGGADPAWESEAGYLRLARDLGFMPYYWYGHFWVARPEYDGVEVVAESHGPITVRRWVTPIGELREESRYLESASCTAITRHAVQTELDLRILLYLLDHRRLASDCLDDYPARLAQWEQYDGIPCLGMPRSPLPQFFHEWAGVQNGVYLLFDHGDLVRRVLGLLEEQESPIVDAVCSAAPPLLHFPDNLTSDHFTNLFDPFMAGPYRRRLDRFHAAGIRCAVHLDGTVRGLLPQLAAIGFDAAEALTPQPVGDISMEEMSALAGGRMALWGGVPGAMFAPPYTWDDVRAHVEQLLRAWRGRPFVVGVADQIPPNGDIRMCRMISDLVRGRPD